MRGFWRTSECDDENIDRRLDASLAALSDTRTLKRFLSVIASVNLLLWLFVILFADLARQCIDILADLGNKLTAAAAGIPFGLGFFIVYCGFRLKFPDVEEIRLESSLMSGYNYGNKSVRRWRTWVASVLGGVINALFLILAAFLL